MKPFPSTEPLSDLEVAQSAAGWIAHASRETTHGLVWRLEPESADDPDHSLLSLSNGSGGIIPLFQELSRATGAPQWEEQARGGADHLAASWREYLNDYPEPTKMRNRCYTLNYGLAGIAFALVEAWRFGGAPQHREAACEVTEAIIAGATQRGAGVTWTEAPAMSGDAGILAYLVWAADALSEPNLLETAAASGEWILSKGELDDRGGMRWLGLDPTAMGYAEGTYVPGFAGGTAGISYALARLSAATGEVRFLEAAEAGLAHLRAIATNDGDASLICHHEPGGEDLFYLGRCMGPAGTARAFYEVFRQNQEPEHLEWVERLARGVLRAGAPGQQSPGYWNTISQCCGTAGLLDFFMSLEIVTGQSVYREAADQASEILRRRATDPDKTGHRWYYAFMRGKPALVVARTDYKSSAGPAMSLLRHHLKLNGSFSATRFPDDPFPAASE